MKAIICDFSHVLIQPKNSNYNGRLNDLYKEKVLCNSESFYDYFVFNEELYSFFMSIKEFSNLFDEKRRNKILSNLVELDGIGETQIDSIESFFSNEINKKITINLIKQLRILNYSIQNKKGKFANKKMMFTGGFQEMSRSEAKSIAENNGGKVLGSLSKKLDLLVVGDSKPTKRKIDQAKKMKIKILTEKEWNRILNS